MTDAMAATTSILGSGGLVTLVTFLINRNKDAREKFEKQMNLRMEEANARVDESIRLRSDDLRRLTELEKWRDKAIETMDSLRDEKIALVTQVIALKSEIADLKLQITAYQQNEIAFHVQINDLQVREAAKTGELHAAEQRLAAIKTAHSSGTLTDHTLYQAIKE